MALPSDSKARKAIPLATGLLDYFPDALAAVAEVSRAGNEQHNPGEPLHWDRSKSADHADCAARHFVERGTLDADGQRHTAKAVWRLLALLQLEIEAETDYTVITEYGKVPEPAWERAALGGLSEGARRVPSGHPFDTSDDDT